ncbi:MAG: alpha-galactosidase [Clostridia bacterium]|nr:alpha-galactosidase [Clostridia bacterium]
MSIFFDSDKRMFKLDTSETSYVIGIYEENYLLGLYYGAKIPDMNFTKFMKRNPSASFSPVNPVIGEHGFSPDTAPIEYGCNGAGDFRISALAVRNANGDTVTDIRYTDHRIYKGKKAIPNMPSTYVNSDDEAETLEIDAVDKVTGAMVTLVYTVFENCPVMTKSVKVKNTSDKTIYLERVMSACNDFYTMDYDIITLWGRHVKERNIERRPLAHGVQGVESKRGVSGHSQNPFVALAKHDATEDFGDVYGFNLVYSGNFSALAECDHNCSTRLIMGINPNDFEWTLSAGEEFYAPEVVCVFTDKGIGEMSRIYHRFYNNNLIRGKYKTEKRPLLINSWEAAYFDFDKDKLVAFAKEAKKLGIEMLVMDDGWFGKRNDDTNSLGDWFVNEEKLVGGLKPLIDGVNAEGLKFGIWYEPEMISPDSELFRAHPDWHVHVANREPMLGRHQYVLDVSREDVRENIWNQLYKVLSENKIDYVKWDFNRNIADAGSALLPPERKKEFFHRFILGTYDLMNRLVTTFPDILFEGCSGGGGRFDPAMLAYSPQIWTSDNTDPIERLYIQFGTSMCYPASCQSAHVSACDRTGYETKGNVAMWGTFGYELDPRKLTDDEREIVKAQIAEYHKTYKLVRDGDLYRIISPFDNPFNAAWEIVAPDKQSFMFTLVCMRANPNSLCFVKFKGLDPDKYYTCENDSEVYSGAFLMNVGLNLTEKANRDGKSITLYFS